MVLSTSGNFLILTLRIRFFDLGGMFLDFGKSKQRFGKLFLDFGESFSRMDMHKKRTKIGVSSFFFMGF